MPPRSWLRGLALWAGSLLCAQPGLDPALQAVPTFRIQGVKEGLPHGTVHSLAFDPEGRLVVATADGLALFSGKGWTPIALPVECRSRYTRALAFSPEGDLWVGTQQDGLWQRKGEAWIHHDAGRGLPAKRINGLLLEGRGEDEVVWAATSDQGLARFHRGTWTVWGPAEGMPDAWLWRVRRVGGQLWCLSLKGAALWQDGRILPHPLDSQLLGGEANEVIEVPGPPEAGGGLWLSQWGMGLAHRVGNRWETLSPGKGFPSRHPVALAHTRSPDGAQVLWVGTYDAGLFWRKGSGPWERLGQAQGFPATGVYDLLPDPRGRPLIWAGLRISGVAALEMAGWRTLGTLQGLPSERVLALTTTREQGRTVYWVGTELGIGRWDRGRWATFGAKEGLPNPLVNALMETRAFGAPRLLAGTLEGIAAFEGGRWKVIAGPQELPSAQIVQFLERETPQGIELWVATEGGLARYLKGAWTTFTRAQGLPHDWVYALALARTPKGGEELWIGTRGGGTARLHQGRWQPFGLAEGLPNADVYCLRAQALADGSVRMWAGTLGGGLSWLDPEVPGARWHQLVPQTYPALATSAVVSMLADRHGALFLGTPRGLVRVEGQGEPGPHWTTRLYTEGDGLPSRVCNTGALHADDLGRLWVGTAGGLGLFTPAEEPAMMPLGRPILESVHRGVRLLPRQGFIDIPPGKGPLEMRYLLPAYYRTEDLRYRTQVLGLEDTPSPWVPEGRREFTGLGAGSYLLRVEAMDPLGRISPPLDVAFRVRPEPWRSPWAYALYLAACLAGGWAAHRIRVNYLSTRNRLLSERVRQAVAVVETQKSALEEANARLVALDQTKSRMLGIVAHDLRNPLNAIMLNAALLEEPALESAETLEVGRKIQSVADFMNTLLTRFLDLEAIESGRLKMDLKPLAPGAILRHTQEIHGPKALTKGIDLRVDTPGDLPRVLADPLYLQEVVDNLVSNALKFTPKGPPARRVWVHAGPGWFQVQDEGPGFTPEDQAKAFGQFVKLSARPTGGESSSGLGLSIVKALVEHMGGRVELDSAPGAGARFTVRLPLADPQGAAASGPG